MSITATCEKCDTSESFTDAKLVNPWFEAHRCPKPPVDLPTEPTLGWLTTKAGGVLVGTWETYTPVISGDEKREYALSRERDIPADRVTAFTRATAVPTEALDELRNYRERLDFNCATPAVRRINAFLAAVDKANEANA